MRKSLLILIFIYLTLLNISKVDSSSLSIGRSRAHEDKSGPYTPLVVTLSTEDTSVKKKPVDLICIVDVSTSMDGTPLDLVKKSLEYLVNKGNETDNFAMITFSDGSKIVNNFTRLTEENKPKLLESISNLRAFGNTNIYSGLLRALELLKDDYKSGERVASMILLSDGADNYYSHNVVNKFKQLMIDQKKTDYVFTLHSFGYGSSYDAELLNKIALIKDGAYFHIYIMKDVAEAYLKIYSSLSTVMDVNIQLVVQSKYNIMKVYGIEDMYEANIATETISSFNVKIIQVIHGKKYEFVLLVDIPITTPIGTEVLNATVHKLGLKSKYYWDGKYSPPAYEEYIRCIVVIIFIEGYESSSSGNSIIQEGKEWIKTNYNGTRDWLNEFDEAKNDLQSGKSGKANLLSKITELKTTKIGIHYDEGNSYQRQLIDNYHGLDVSKMKEIEIRGEKVINYIKDINYYYFYLKDGKGEINKMPFSGQSSSLVIFTNETKGNINMISLSDSMNIYYLNKSISRMQTNINFNRVGKFIIKKDFPYDFYTLVDGKRDILFNIEFLKLPEGIKLEENLEINAFILNDDDIDDLVKNEYLLNSRNKFKGNFNNELKQGKIIIKKSDISRHLDIVHNNFLYIIIKKISNIDIDITNSIEGQFFFIPINYALSSLPENYKIYNHLEQGDSTGHIYTLEIDSSSDNNLFNIEFEKIDNDELDIKILNYQNYVDNIIDLYNDFNEYDIEKISISNKIYLKVRKKYYKDSFDKKIIISIFSSNKDHIPSSNLSYVFKYTTDYKEFPLPIFSTELMTESNFVSQETEFFESTYNLIQTTNTVKTTHNIVQTQTTYNIIQTTNTVIPNVVIKIRVIILGFAKFTYITSNKIINFFIYFAYIEKTVYSKKIVINTNIKYKTSKRFLQTESKQKGECVLIEDDSNNQKKYKCSIETNGEEIDNIKLDKNITSDDNNIDFSNKEISPMGINYINKLQDVGDTDIFDGKKLYILENAEVNIDNDKNELNITGNITDNNFNYDKINLEMILIDNNEEKSENISCIPNKENNKYNLKCNTKNEMSGKLNSAYANLGNANLIIDISDSNKKTINFEQIFSDNNGKKNYKSKKGGLSTGGIIAIIIPCIVILIGLIIIIIYYKTKKPKIVELNTNTTVLNYGTTTTIN